MVRTSTDTTNQMNATDIADLADIAFTLRFQNTTEEEDSQIPFPWSHQNIPQPIKIESRQITGGGYKPHTLVIEHFADGSKFGRSEPI